MGLVNVEKDRLCPVKPLNSETIEQVSFTQMRKRSKVIKIMVGPPGHFSGIDQLTNLVKINHSADSASALCGVQRDLTVSCSFPKCRQCGCSTDLPSTSKHSEPSWLSHPSRKLKAQKEHKELEILGPQEPWGWRAQPGTCWFGAKMVLTLMESFEIKDV